MRSSRYSKEDDTRRYEINIGVRHVDFVLFRTRPAHVFRSFITVDLIVVVYVSTDHRAIEYYVYNRVQITMSNVY
jgi:hypothetical protein